jgi:hypothetical protein
MDRMDIRKRMLIPGILTVGSVPTLMTGVGRPLEKSLRKVTGGLEDRSNGEIPLAMKVIKEI